MKIGNKSKSGHVEEKQNKANSSNKKLINVKIIILIIIKIIINF